jgi:N-carbamoylputrescine amidase
VQRGHAVANGLPVIVPNRTGTELSPDGDKIEFWGHSFVAGPQGEMLAEAPANSPATLLVELDLKRSEEVRRIWPFLRDRRVDGYQNLVRRFID